MSDVTHKLVDGVVVELTPAEIAEINARPPPADASIETDPNVKYPPTPEPEYHQNAKRRSN